MMVIMRDTFPIKAWYKMVVRTNLICWGSGNPSDSLAQKLVIDIITHVSQLLLQKVSK